MNITSLQSCIKCFCLQGYVPMYVNATAGTTVYGAFDPINEIADICEKYNMWLHVDVRECRLSSKQIMLTAKSL